MTDEKLVEVLENLHETTCLKCIHKNLCYFRKTIFKALGNYSDTRFGLPFSKLGARMYAEIWLYGFAYFCNYFQSSNQTTKEE